MSAPLVMGKMSTSDPWPIGCEDVAALLGVQLGTVHMWRKRGVLVPCDGTIAGAPWWWRSAVVAWAERTGRLAVAVVAPVVAAASAPVPGRRIRFTPQSCRGQLKTRTLDSLFKFRGGSHPFVASPVDEWLLRASRQEIGWGDANVTPVAEERPSLTVLPGKTVSTSCPHVRFGKCWTCSRVEVIAVR